MWYCDNTLNVCIIPQLVYITHPNLCILPLGVLLSVNHIWKTLLKISVTKAGSEEEFLGLGFRV